MAREVRDGVEALRTAHDDELGAGARECYVYLVVIEEKIVHLIDVVGIAGGH